MRRAVYRANIARGDFFVLRNLQTFLHRALAESVSAGTIVGDIGCGEQPLRQTIESLGGSYVGVDVGQNRSGTVDVLAPITEVPLPDAIWVILCTEVLEHVPDTSGAFSELGRLCQAGGTIIVTTPFAYPLHEEPHDYVRLTPHQITQCAARNGLETVELTTAGDELSLATVWCNFPVAVNRSEPKQNTIPVEYADAPAREPPGRGNQPCPSFSSTPEVFPQYLVRSAQTQPTRSSESCLILASLSRASALRHSRDSPRALARDSDARIGRIRLSGSAGFAQNAQGTEEILPG